MTMHLVERRQCYLEELCDEVPVQCYSEELYDKAVPSASTTFAPPDTTQVALIVVSLYTTVALLWDALPKWHYSQDGFP